MPYWARALHSIADMANPETRPRSAPQKNPTEWPDNPPLPPPELDPTGEGQALRSHAHPGDDTVFAANADEKETKMNKPRNAAPEPELADDKDDIRTEDDAEHSRVER